MTRTYALFKLLEHGPLTFTEIREICGWGKPLCSRALVRLIEQGMVKRESGAGRFIYALAPEVMTGDLS